MFHGVSKTLGFRDPGDAEPCRGYRLSYNKIYSFYYQLAGVGTWYIKKIIPESELFLFIRIRTPAKVHEKNNYFQINLFLSELFSLLSANSRLRYMGKYIGKYPEINLFLSGLFFSFISKSLGEVHGISRITG